jgi:hypothetical protein
MANKVNLTGQVFGHLTAIKDSGKRARRKDGSSAVLWLCQCDCGKQTYVATSSLTTGQTTSCGHVKAANLETGADHHASMLTDKVPATSHTGYRNISMTFRGSRWRYRVAVTYDHRQHGGLRDTLKEALELREELRAKYWPGYKTQK